MSATAAKGPPSSLFQQNVIALVWDFDKTLIPGHMQQPIFAEYGIDGEGFWREVNREFGLFKKREEAAEDPRHIRVSREIFYLNSMLRHVEKGVFQGLNNDKLRELGQKIEFCPGLPEFFSLLRSELDKNPTYRRYGIEIEHYVVSAGIRKIVQGSSIDPHLTGVWGSEFIEEDRGQGPVVSRLSYVVDNTSKTRALFEINKGTNINPRIDVNSFIEASDRRVPFSNMIYIGDGPSDVPAFSIVNKNGGHTFAVYQKDPPEHYGEVRSLQKQKRIQAFFEADYRQGSPAHLELSQTIREIAGEIVNMRMQHIDARVAQPPGHHS